MLGSPIFGNPHMLDAAMCWLQAASKPVKGQQTPRQAGIPDVLTNGAGLQHEVLCVLRTARVGVTGFRAFEDGVASRVESRRV